MSRPAPSSRSGARPAADGKSSLTLDFWLGELDLRPIALFRVAFGLFILYDLFDLLPNLWVWFSDAGVMPRSALLAEMVRPNRFCLLDAFGMPEATYVYWGLAALAVLSMTVGYHTRVSQAAAYLFIAGFNERIPELFDGSDSVIRLTLFFLCFCPSGNRYSVDAVRAAARGQPLAEKGIALPMRLVQGQVAWVYFCTFLHKLGGSTWHDGTALHYALHLSHVFARPWTASIADIPWLMKVGTYFTLVLEAGFLFLAFSPVFNRRAKALALAAATALHVAIMFTVNVGLFSYLMPVTYLAFFEPEWTEWLVDRLRLLCGRGETLVLYDGKCPLCRQGVKLLAAMDQFNNLAFTDFRAGELAKRLPKGLDLKPKALEKRMHVVSPAGAVNAGFLGIASILRRTPAGFAVAPLMRLPGVVQLGGLAYDWAADRRHALSGCTDEACTVDLAPKPRPPLLSPVARRTARDLVYAALAALFVCVQWYSLPNQFGRYNLPRPAEYTVQMLSLWNIWDMFAPEPLRTDYHLRATAEYSDGSTDDLFGGPAGGPGEVRGFWFTRWWKYLENVTGGGQTMPREWARWECRIHNFAPGTRQLYTFTLKKENQIIPPMGQPWPPVQVIDSWSWRCYEKPGPKRSPKLMTPAVAEQK